MNHTDIKSIVGESVSGICFVQDYVEMHFDGKIVRAFTNVRTRIRDESRIFPDAGSRDAICRLIGAVVKSVDFDASTIEIKMVNGEVVLIPLDASGVVGGEALHFVPGENMPIEVW